MVDVVDPAWADRWCDVCHQFIAPTSTRERHQATQLHRGNLERDRAAVNAIAGESEPHRDCPEPRRGVA